MSTMPRQIPDSECKQGKCGATTTGCWDQCSLKQFPVHFVGLAFPVAPLIPTERQAIHQCRFIEHSEWIDIATEQGMHALMAGQSANEYEFRTLYAAPPAVTAKPALAAPVEQASADLNLPDERRAYLAKFSGYMGSGYWTERQDQEFKVWLAAKEEVRDTGGTE